MERNKLREKIGKYEEHKRDVVDARFGREFRIRGFLCGARIFSALCVNKYRVATMQFVENYRNPRRLLRLSERARGNTRAVIKIDMVYITHTHTQSVYSKFFLLLAVHIISHIFPAYNNKYIILPRNSIHVDIPM